VVPRRHPSTYTFGAALCCRGALFTIDFVKQESPWIARLLPRWISRIVAAPGPENSGFSRRVRIVIGVGAVLCLVGAGIWRAVATAPAVVAYSELASALEAGEVERLRVERNGTRLVAVLASGGGGAAEVSAAIPAGVIGLQDLERWTAAGAEVDVVRGGVAPGQVISLAALLLVGGALLLFVRA